MKTRNDKSGRAIARRGQLVAVILCGMMGTLSSQVAFAGGFTVGTFTSASDLGLDVGFPPPQSLTLAQHAGGVADGQDTVGAVTYTNPASFFGASAPSGTWPGSTAPSFGDAQMNDLFGSYVVAHSVFNQKLTRTFSGLQVGHDYRLRLLIYDGDPNALTNGGRSGTLDAGGDLFALDYLSTIGGTWTNNIGAVVSYQLEYTAPFTVTWTPTPQNPSSHQVVLSAFDLVELPEPSTALLLGIGGLALLRRRR